jgi:hypothetical protein
MTRSDGCLAALKLDDKRAAEPVAWIKAIYTIEEECRGKPPDERLEARQKHSIPVLDAFEKWCDEMEPKLGKSGKLAEAVRYAKQQRVYVRRCFSDGRFEIDNGACERELREPAIGRKNFCSPGRRMPLIDWPPHTRWSRPVATSASRPASTCSTSSRSSRLVGPRVG